MEQSPACPPAGTTAGVVGYCTEVCPCGEGQGGCSDDDDCDGDLICSPAASAGVRTCQAPVPKKAAWSDCVEADECSSGVCGCAASKPDRQQCLPDYVAKVACTIKLTFWEACEGDDACESGTCACWSGSKAKEVCLPSGVASVICEAKNPAYAACAADSECQSNRCACHAGSQAEKQCLPDQLASADCQKSDWGFCLDASECLSGICDCWAGSDQKMCLPPSVKGDQCASQQDWTACTEDKTCLSGLCRRCYTDNKLCLPLVYASNACVGQPPAPTLKDDWSTCADGAECESSSCGCSSLYATEQRCLPSWASPLTCKAASWATCTDDGQCASGNCGCSASYPSQQRCLPLGVSELVCGATTPPPTGQCIELQTTLNLNIRADAGLQYAVIGKAPAAAVVEVLGPIQGCWHQVRYCAITGWAYSNALGCDPKYEGGTWIDLSQAASCSSMTCP